MKGSGASERSVTEPVNQARIETLTTCETLLSEKISKIFNNSKAKYFSLSSTNSLQ